LFALVRIRLVHAQEHAVHAKDHARNAR